MKYKKHLILLVMAFNLVSTMALDCTAPPVQKDYCPDFLARVDKFKDLLSKIGQGMNNAKVPAQELKELAEKTRADLKEAVGSNEEKSIICEGKDGRRLFSLKMIDSKIEDLNTLITNIDNNNEIAYQATLHKILKDSLEGR